MGEHQQVALGLVLPRPGRAGSDLERGLVAAHRVRTGDQGGDPVVRLCEQPGGAGQHAVHEPRRGCGAGQRFQQRDHPVHRQELHHQQIDRERGQVRAVAGLTRPGALGPGRGVHPCAAASNLVLVELDDLDLHSRNLVGLVAVDDPTILGRTQVGAAAAATPGEPVHPLIGALGPGQMRPRVRRIYAETVRTLVTEVLSAQLTTPAKVTIAPPSQGGNAGSTPSGHAHDWRDQMISCFCREPCAGERVLVISRGQKVRDAVLWRGYGGALLI